jgi:hypothetical protein
MAKEIKDEIQKIREEIRDEEYQKEKSAREQRVKEERALSRSAEADQLAKEGIIKSERGAEETLWEDAVNRAKNAIGRDVMAYNDWRAAMMEMMSMFGALNKAINHSLTVGFYFPLKVAIVDKVLLPLKDDIQAALAGNPEIDLPKLQHYVSLNDDGTLNIQLPHSDNDARKEELKELFEGGIVEWLKTNGYKPDTDNPKKFVDSSNHALDPVKFEELKNDPDFGIDHFHPDNSDVTLHNRP